MLNVGPIDKSKLTLRLDLWYRTAFTDSDCSVIVRYRKGPLSQTAIAKVTIAM